MLDGVGINVTPHPLYPWEGQPVPIVQKAEWVPRPVWTGVENVVPTAIRSLDLSYNKLCNKELHNFYITNINVTCRGETRSGHVGHVQTRGQMKNIYREETTYIR